MFDPQSGLLTRDSFWHDLKMAISEAADRSIPLSIARFSFGKDLDERASLDAARLMSRLIRNIDFATRDEEGAILVGFMQTNLRNTHVTVRRLATSLKRMILAPQGEEPPSANVTLATLKAGDTLDTLIQSVAVSP